MPTYPCTELANGELVFALNGQERRIVARRERQNQMPVVSMDARVFGPEEQYLRGKMQVSFLSYQREDGAIIHGHYMGNVVEILDLNPA